MDPTLVILIGLTVVFFLFEGGYAMLWRKSRQFNGSHGISGRGRAGSREDDEIKPEDVKTRIEDELRGLRHQQKLLEYEPADLAPGARVNDHS